MSKLQEPQGVPFFNINSGDTHYARLEAQIQAYINSSDMGINASRDQDYGWRLGADWVKKVRAYRRDGSRMRELIARNGGQKVTTTQVLYAIYGEQVRAYAEQSEEEGAPFEDQYLKDIAVDPEPVAAPAVASPVPLPDTPVVPAPGDTSDLNEVPEDVADEDLEPSDEPEAPGVDPAKPGKDRTVNRDAGDGQFITDEEAKADPGGTVTETVSKPDKPAKNPTPKKKA